MSATESLKPGQYQVLITKVFGPNENVQVSTIVDNPAKFDAARKQLYSDFIAPRQKEYEDETIGYQKRMAEMANEVEENFNKKGKK